MDKTLYKLFIKRYRQELRHMTQEELADLVGIAPSYISMLEQDNITRTRSPKLTLLRDIAYSLGVCPNDILHFPCLGCQLLEGCGKRQYFEDNGEDEDFFENNIIYYL